MPKNILVIGNGGREHALLWKLAQSPQIGKLYSAPGNGGTRELAENLDIDPNNVDLLAQFAQKNKIDLTIVGPETPLAVGIVNHFRHRGLRIFGPTREAAQIETSKSFAKKIMLEENIPTAPFQVFDDYEEAATYLRKHGAPIVIKADGLAFGKGVFVCDTLPKAERALARIMLRRAYGDAGDKVIIEEFLKGQELSIHAICDGKTSLLLPPAQDHKSVFDNDRGLNTGGMGTIAPVPWVSDGDLEMVRQKIVLPALNALSKRGYPFMGCLYPGLKITESGPKVLEFNARLGDPETQCYMRLLKTDLIDILEACIDGKLADLTIEWHAGFAVCVVLASGGYPGLFKKGVPIHGVSEAEKVAGVIVFHAGTEFTDQFRTSGGRVLGITAVGETLSCALEQAYKAASLINFKEMHYRKDIGRPR